MMTSMQRWIGIGALAVLAACGGGKGSGSGSAATDTAQSAASTGPTDVSPDGWWNMHHPGYALFVQQDCKTCHLPDKQLTGPAFTMIAARYDSTKPGTIQTLAKKVISGGKGNWGDAIMTPHAGLSEKDAEELVRYVLSYKK